MNKTTLAVMAAAAVSACFGAEASDAEAKIEALRSRAREIVSKMTLDEKLPELLSWAPGVPRLGIPHYDWWSEGLHGVARNGKATVFPEPIGMAASFDPELVKEIASAIGDEGRIKYEAAKAKDRHGTCIGLTFWSPNINIFRDPRWGRGMETWGEDPYLTSRMGVAFVRGIQGDDPVYLKAAACAKHYAVHSGPEGQRHTFDAHPSKRDLWETYLPAFRALVQDGKVEAVMSAYNRVYGESATSSEFLLRDVLRNQFGFKGHIVSDCGAVADIHNGHALEKSPEAASARALKHGLDLECGSTFGSLKKAIADGLVDEKTIDEALVHAYTTRLRLGILEEDSRCPYAKTDPSLLCSPKHVALARKMAAESMVLIKNDGVLPLDESKTTSYTLIGALATDAFALMGNYYGMSPKLVTYLSGFADYVEPGTGMHYCPGYYQGMPASEATGVWVEDDVVIAFIGNTGIFEGEEGDAVAAAATQGDRSSLKLPAGQLAFLRNVRRDVVRRSADHPTKLVTVITGGSPVELDEVMEMSDAVVLVWYAGEEGGRALPELLFGKRNFCGRLPITFPTSADVLPEFTDYSMDGRTYRYQKDGIAYPFGYGLTYSKVSYESVEVLPGGRKAKVVLSNDSDCDAVEVAQIYVETPNSGKGSPLVSLRGFSRVAVPAHAKATAEIDLDEYAFTEIAEDGSVRKVDGECRVWAAAAAPCARSRELGVSMCSTTFAKK